ncbi:hypothetical protein [Pseudomonas sp. 273]|uniref:hypothetical protein n=1 Tax=Pseudomonas sp. 273 TaxID=75692 RepID=UPI0023D87146|nr:hypothetical protein [Pseudomonas sp. 273]
MKRSTNTLQPEDTPQSKVSRLDAIARHPLTLLLAGFLVTGILGGAITRNFDDAAEYRHNIEKRKAASKTLLLSAAKLAEISSRIHSALVEKQSKDRVDGYLTSYEEARAEWNRNYFILPFSILEFADGRNAYEDVREVLNWSLHNNIRALTDCTNFMLGHPDQIYDFCPDFMPIDYPSPTERQTLQDRLRIVTRCIRTVSFMLALYSSSTVDYATEPSRNQLSWGCRPQRKIPGYKEPTPVWNLTLKEKIRNYINDHFPSKTRPPAH